ncbi:hypothetical protein I552_5230 [Mycobacterium xenopi 3993]|nr:hypothetical protein I552_5230 [Mycobacterium xenopi 3993]
MEAVCCGPRNVQPPAGIAFRRVGPGTLRARDTKERLCQRAEELAESTDWSTTSAEFRKLLGEWKAAGRAAREVDDALWRRFKAAQDKFFQARNAATAERDAELRANAAAKEALLAEAEKLDTSNHDAARAALRSIAERWDKIGKVPRERSAELERRLRAVEKRVRDATEPTWSDPQAQARPSSSAPAPSNSNAKPKRRRPPAVAKKPTRPRPTPSSGASGRGRRRRADPQTLGPPAGPGGLSSSGLSRLSSSVLDCWPAAARRRCSSAASCTMVRDHTTRPSETSAGSR